MQVSTEKGTKPGLEGRTKPRQILDSLQVRNYRCFKHLTVEKLGLVNLVVGRNNVGKTALLEAIWTYANDGYERVIYEILRERNEIPPFSNGIMVQPESSQGLRNLFFGRPYFQYFPGDYPDELDEFMTVLIGENVDFSGNEPVFVEKVLQIRGLRPDSSSRDGIPRLKHIGGGLSPVDGQFIRPGGLDDQKLVEFWDDIEKYVQEDFVTKALKLIEPGLVDIRFSGYPTGSFSRIPVVRLQGATERVPLRSLGEGMSRILGIASALVASSNGILLIDEIENGLHYSVLSDIWRLIFETARDREVQVFATTHSYDCIEAFAKAAINDVKSDGMLIRLARKEDEIKAFTFDETQLETITKEGIEVR